MKNQFVAIAIIVAVALGGVYLFSQKQTNSSKSATSSQQGAFSQQQEEPITQNATYDHIHSIFRVPADGTILMGTHNGLFKSTDGGKTFERAQIKSSNPAINPNGEFMNFAYDVRIKSYMQELTIQDYSKVLILERVGRKLIKVLRDKIFMVWQ